MEAALLHGERLDGARGSLQITDALRWRETRTGFVGEGLAAAHQDVSGIPPGRPVSPQSPLFMGFKSGLRKNQATETYVTIADGPFAEGTTMQVSYMRLRLDSWYENLSYGERVARMYSPETTPEEVTHFTTDAESEPKLIAQAIQRYGVRRPLADFGPRAPQRQATDHPPRLQHRRWWSRGIALRLRAAFDRRLRHHPERDERVRRPAPEPSDHRHDQQRDQRIYLRASTCQLHPALARRTARSPCCGGERRDSRARRRPLR